MDLDQAMHLERRTGGGYRVHYAIADVAAYVRPDSALAAETWRRGETVYLPDGSVPLHPPVLSEGAASLLPGEVRAAVVWTIDLDAHGGTEATTVERAAVRSRAKLNYAGVQADADRGALAEPIALLPEIGALLVERGLARGAVNLPIPEQEVEPDGDGWKLLLRAPYPVENFNAQISLLTGMAAARLMLDGRVGLRGARGGRGHRAGAGSGGAGALPGGVRPGPGVGEEFAAAVLAGAERGAGGAMEDPGGRARCAGEGLTAGTRIRARLTVADPI